MPEPENKYNQWLKKLTHEVLVRNLYCKTKEKKKQNHNSWNKQLKDKVLKIRGKRSLT
jgi:hypothetical protein